MSDAEWEARDSGTPFVGSEHVLLAILKLGSGAAYVALTKHGVTYASVKAMFAPPATPTPAKQIKKQKTKTKSK